MLDKYKEDDKDFKCDCCECDVPACGDYLYICNGEGCPPCKLKVKEEK